jgi:lipid-A-disaccharide synthase
MSLRVLVSTGEPSGDLHAARVVTAIRQRWPDASIEAVGGPRLAEAGANVRWSATELAAMGFIEVVASLPAHLRLLRTLRHGFRSRAWDLVIVVDYPGFHLRVAEAARKAGIPVLWYIAPQLWAWRPQRAARLAAAVDRLAVILPFETDFFAKVGVRATYVGHPLLDREPPPTREAARTALGIASEAPTLALFPGSRRGEVERLWPAYRDAARLLLGSGQAQRVVVATTPAGAYPGAEGFDLVPNAHRTVLAAADAVLAKSGTTTLEAALADVPMVVAYRTHPITFRLIQRLVTVRWASLVNLVADREVVPEVMQDAVTADALAQRIAPLLDRTTPEATAQRVGLAEVRHRLGAAGASARVAEIVAEMVAR